MTILRIFIAACIISFSAIVFAKADKKPALVKGCPKSVSADFDKLVESSSLNWMEKEINKKIAKSIKVKKVVLEKIADYLYIQVVPNFAYAGDAGEEQLGEDLMGLLGSVKSSENAAFLVLELKKLRGMKLPFSKKIINSFMIEKSCFDRDIDITFFIDLNALTARIRNAFEHDKSFILRYNSKQRFYRIEKKGLKTFVFVHIANTAYQLVFSGENIESIIKNKKDDINYLFNAVKKYEKKILSDSKLTFDGRYIRGKNILVDLWFLKDFTFKNKKSADTVFKMVLAHKPIKVVGDEKGGK